MKFLEETIITRFGVPTKITTNNAKVFSSMELNEFYFKYGIVFSHSSYYYRQGNGLAESNNKNIRNILKMIVGENKKSWDSKIKYALWVDHTTTKTSIGKNPFKLVYRIKSHLPINLQILALQVAQHFATDKEAL
jgi:transposase InsO family protein